MALKPGRDIRSWDISYFMNEVAERGGIAFLSTAGSGEALDQSTNLCTYAASSGDIPVGLLMNDMVNIDQTRQHINWQKDEVQQGGKVTLCTRGWVVTNMLSSGTIAGGNPAYADVDSATDGFNLTNIRHLGGLVARPWVGRFQTTADEDGYVKVYVDLPAQISE